MIQLSIILDYLNQQMILLTIMQIYCLMIQISTMNTKLPGMQFVSNYKIDGRKTGTM